MEYYEDTPYEEKYYVEIIEKDENVNSIVRNYLMRKWFNSIHAFNFIDEKSDARISSLEERMLEVEKKVGLIFSTGIRVEPMIVPDFPQEEVAKCMQEIEIYFDDHDSLNPWHYAEERDLDVKLVLLCIDKLISAGKLEW